MLKAKEQVTELVIDLHERVMDMLKYREDYKRVKQFDKADAIREKLNAMGLEIKDTPEGVEVSGAFFKKCNCGCTLTGYCSQK